VAETPKKGVTHLKPTPSVSGANSWFQGGLSFCPPISGAGMLLTKPDAPDGNGISTPVKCNVAAEK